MKQIFRYVFILITVSVCFVSCQSYLDWYNKTSGTNYQSVWSVNLDSSKSSSSQQETITNTYEIYEYESLKNKYSISSYVDEPKYIVTKPLMFKKEVYEIYEYESLKNKYSISSYVDEPKYIVTIPLMFEKEVYEIYEYESLKNKYSISSYTDKPKYIVPESSRFK